MRSRAVSLPLLCWFSIALLPPPSRICSSSFRMAETRSAMDRILSSNRFEVASIRVVRMELEVSVAMGDCYVKPVVRAGANRSSFFPLPVPSHRSTTILKLHCDSTPQAGDKSGGLVTMARTTGERREAGAVRGMEAAEWTPSSFRNLCRNNEMKLAEASPGRSTAPDLPHPLRAESCLHQNIHRRSDATAGRARRE